MNNLTILLFVASCVATSFNKTCDEAVTPFDKICDEMNLLDLPASLNSLSELKALDPSKYEKEGLSEVEALFQDEHAFNLRLKWMREQIDEDATIRLDQLQYLRTNFPYRYSKANLFELEEELEEDEFYEMMLLQQRCKTFPIPDEFRDLKKTWETMVANWGNDVIFMKFYRKFKSLLSTLDGDDAEKIRHFMNWEFENKILITERRLKEKKEKRAEKKDQNRKQREEIMKQSLLAKGNELPEIYVDLSSLKISWEKLVSEWYDEDSVKRNYSAVMQELKSCERKFGNKKWFIKFEETVKDYIPKIKSSIREHDNAEPLVRTSRDESKGRKRKRD